MTDFANLVVAVPGDPTLLELYKAQNDVDSNDTSQDLVLSQYLETVSYTHLRAHETRR